MTHLSSALWAEDEERFIASTLLFKFRDMDARAQLVFLALPSTSGGMGSCVGYAFVMIDNDLHIAMRRHNATWNVSQSNGEVAFAVSSGDIDQFCGKADWQTSVLSDRDTNWAAQAWDLMRKKYPWLKPAHLDSDPMIVRLIPRTISLLRFDEDADRLWRTTIYADGDNWKIDQHAAKGANS